MILPTILTAILLPSLVVATVLPKRQPSTIWQSPYSGTIVAPTDNQVTPFGVDFAFEYDVSAWCEPAYAPFTVYLTEGAAPPVFDNVTESGTLAEGAFVFDFGKFVVSRFGLPPQGPPPPATLTMPAADVLNVPIGPESKFYLAVVEEFDGCPGHITVEYSLTSVPLALSSIA